MWFFRELYRLLREILEAIHHGNKTQHEILKVEQASMGYLAKIAEAVVPKPITGFTFKQQGDTMPLLPIAPGFSPVFTATPTPAGTVLAPGTSAITTSSDPVNAPITTDASGLVITAAIPTTATVGGTFTLTTTYTNLDGNIASTTSQPFTIVAAPPTDVTGFTFAQTS